jgi:Tfp pilus assembly protein PilE
MTAPPVSDTPSTPAAAAPAVGRRRPLTLLQLMLAMSVLALLAMWAIPRHQRLLKHLAVERAVRDLSALHAQLDHYWAQHRKQRSSTPPVSPLSITSPDGAVSNTVSLLQQPYAQGWRPQPNTAFEFGAAFESKGYTLTALGQHGMACRLSIVVHHAAVDQPEQVLRSALGPDCGLQSW